jgi:hypothetical protein
MQQSGRPIVLRLAVSVAWGCLSVSSQAAVVDRVVVSIEDQVITDSEVRLEVVLGSLDASPSPAWDLERKTPLERLVDAAIVRELAGDVAIYRPSDEEVESRLASVQATFVDARSWQDVLTTWGLDDESLATVLRRRVIVERYLARNVQVRSSDRASWWSACDEMLAQTRDRYRIRYIPPAAP